MPAKIAEKRRYGGASFQDRQSDRRERLIRAAIEVFARTGREGATVAAICAQAGLTARYFYESFANSDALFVEAYRFVQRELLVEMDHARDPGDPVRGALTGFFRALAEHPGPARVFLLDPHGREPEMQVAGRDAAARLGQLFAPGAQSPLALSGALGAIIQIARNWIAAGFVEAVPVVVAAALPFARAAADAEAGVKETQRPSKLKKAT